MAMELAQETVWFDKWRYDDAEAQYYEQKSGVSHEFREDCTAAINEVVVSNSIGVVPAASSALKQSVPSTEEEVNSAPLLGSLANQIAKAREDIQNTRAAGRVSGGAPTASSDVINRITKLEGEKNALSKTVQSLEKTVAELTKRLAALECTCKGSSPQQPAAPAKKQQQEEEDDDEDVDLFGSDDDEEEDADAQRIREERLKQYAEKKSKKAGPIAKSSVLLDCKPWDDETDLKQMESCIREIQMDGLVWGAAKPVPLAFGIQKLQILCTVEDEKVSIDDLCEKIQEFEDFVQSVDVAAFNKI